ncbi:kinase-like domain-containing protein [Gigaspora rosea]|uniref:Kinase-like domain-containing protein n=1 Tax=Gigaspora rosea TaxID=44941 RepID=A0A397VQL1_9GLOM|nr:kinase-like domain-containing protein [Gigaspora rosea]
MEHVRSLLAKRTKKCKNRLECVEEAPLICNDCLHEVLESEFDNWSSGNVQIDEFIRNAQRSLSYIRYPEWIPYNFFTEIKCVIRGEFGAVISAKWSQGNKTMQKHMRHYFRSDPCAVVLKKLKDMNQLSLIQMQHQDIHNCCTLYGITKDPSTLEYMLVEPTSVCDRCLSNVLISEFSNWTSGNLQIDKFIQDAQCSSTYVEYPEWIPYNSLSEIKYINRGGFGTVYFAKWNKGAKCFSVIDGDKYHTRSEPCAVALKQLNGKKDTVHLFLKESILSLIYFKCKIKAQFNCCHLYGVTKEPSTSQYMFVMRYAPQGDLRRFLQKNFDKLTLENKLTIAQSICIELQNIHAKGWVHGDLHGGNILLLNEEEAFISDFGLCRPTNETKMLEKKIYGVIPNIAPEILRFQSPYSQAGDIYSLGIILWELVCGIPAFSSRAHCVNLITDICNGLRPKTCHFAPPHYNDLLKKCWNQNPSERPSINAVIHSIQSLCALSRHLYKLAGLGIANPTQKKLKF